MKKNSFIELLETLSKEFNIDKYSLCYVHKDKVLLWDGTTFIEQINKKMSIRKKKETKVENTKNCSPEERLNLLERDLSIIAYYLNIHNRYYKSLIRNRITQFLPLFKQSYIFDRALRIHVSSFSINDIIGLSSDSLEYIMSRLLEKRNTALAKIRRDEINRNKNEQ